MARKKEDSPPPSKAYLVSFGDTMTTLLAFFIVLCSLAEEQSGANLHRGTGSFIRAVDSFGLPGLFSREASANAIARQETSPLYIAADHEDRQPEKNPTGPDANDDGMRIIDREAEEFQRFLNEMERLASIRELPQTRGEVALDFYNRLNKTPPYLPVAYAPLYRRIVSVLQDEAYVVEIIVWATTPSKTAWQRAANQALGVADQIEQSGGLTKSQRSRLLAYAKSWPHADVRRPYLSAIIRKVAPSTAK